MNKNNKEPPLFTGGGNFWNTKGQASSDLTFKHFQFNITSQKMHIYHMILLAWQF